MPIIAGPYTTYTPGENESYNMGVIDVSRLSFTDAGNRLNAAAAKQGIPSSFVATMLGTPLGAPAADGTYKLATAYSKSGQKAITARATWDQLTSTEWWSSPAAKAAWLQHDKLGKSFDGGLTFGDILTGAAVVAGAAFGFPALASAAGLPAAGVASVAAADTVAAGAMSVPGAFGPMSSTAALQASTLPSWLAPAGAATGATLGASEILKGASTVIKAAGAASSAGLAGLGAGQGATRAGSFVSLPSIFNPDAGVSTMATAREQAGATPQNIIQPSSDSGIGVLILAGLGLLFFLVK